GYILGGRSNSLASGDKSQGSQGGYDYWMVKTDDNGIKQWDERYGGSQADVITCMDQLNNGGFLIGGYSFSGISGDRTQANWDATLATTDYWIVRLTVNTGLQAFYADNDGDTYGNAQNKIFACSAPAGYVLDNSDCNDVNASI